MSPASIAQLGLALSAVMIAVTPALAEKCSKCDFSDEPIIVVGTPPKKHQAPTPALPAAKAAALPCLPGNPACHPVPPAAIGVPLPPPSHPVGPPLLSAKPGTGVQKVQLHCSTASTCNDLIAHCAEHGGQWVPGGHNPKGQPTTGDCFID